MPLTHDIGVRIPYPLQKQSRRLNVVCFCFVHMARAIALRTAVFTHRLRCSNPHLHPSDKQSRKALSVAPKSTMQPIITHPITTTLHPNFHPIIGSIAKIVVSCGKLNPTDNESKTLTGRSGPFYGFVRGR